MIEAAPDNSYFEWLCDRTGDTRKAECPEESFMSLLEIMHQTPFRVTIQNDINRAQDGIDLRRAFIRENNDVSYVWLNEQSCSMLEMFIALAERMDMMLEDDDTPYSLEWYFWEMVKNCGLYDYTDDALFNPATRRKSTPSLSGSTRGTTPRWDTDPCSLFVRSRFMAHVICGRLSSGPR